MTRSDALRMMWRRAAADGIAAEHGCHSFRATGITVYLKNGGLLEHAQQMAAHESARTTKLYDRRSDKITLDEVEKCSAAIWMGRRIASPGMLPKAEPLPHLICSRPIFFGGVKDGADQPD